MGYSTLHKLGSFVSVACASLLFVSVTCAASEKILYSFSGGQDGGQPNGTLVFDANGNLYGTTKLGGNLTACNLGCGTVFQLRHTAAGWTERVVFSFNGKDGAVADSGVVFKGAHSLYGTTAFGGPQGNGVVFELTQNPDDTWKETVLHAFHGLQDGNTPFGTLVFDRAGNTYGTTRFGPGKHGSGYGTVFELERLKDGWREKTLYEFRGGLDGADPYAGLTIDSKSTFYGTTFNGGNKSKECLADSCGTVYRLSQDAQGRWKKHTLHRFCSTQPCGDNGNPKANVILDKYGNLYGGTSYNPGGYGTVYELSPDSDGTWREKVLYAFHGSDGNDADGGLVFDHAGNLYGTTDVGGPFSACVDGDGKTYYRPLGCGTVFELSPNAVENWTESVLHDFGRSGDGSHPRRSMTMDKAGRLYGVTTLGGEYGQGIVFEVTP